MSLELYNYYKRKTEPFVPIASNKVGMYVCGPTVYGLPHLGHARSAIVFDTLYRYFQYLGFNVRYVRNITDVGHLEYEIQENGDDKLIKQSKLEKREPMELARFCTEKYHQSLRNLNVLYPSIEPLATGHIPEQLENVQKLVALGAAYAVNSSVYFDMEHFLEKYEDVYGSLSGVSIKDQSAEQSAHQGEKKSPLDFALWKNADLSHLMKWRSPWGEHGFPGWHTECAVMSEKYLGIPFDIHGGGLDLQFPHHEAEIAQSYALHNTLQARYWIYNNLITIERQKMSKSLGNFISVEDCFTGNSPKLSKAYAPNVLRFFLLRSHYRSILDFTDEALLGAKRGLEKLLHLLRNIEQEVLEHALIYFCKNKKNNEKMDADLHSIVHYYSGNLFYDNVCKMLVSTAESVKEGKSRAAEFLLELEHNMNNDLDTPAAIATLFAIHKYLEKCLEEEKNDLDCKIVFYVFSKVVLGIQTQQKASQHFTQLIDAMMEMRKKARDEKKYELSDHLRKLLASANIVINDRKDGTSNWEM